MTHKHGCEFHCPCPGELLNSSMAKFDFVNAAAEGYRFSWNSRAALLQLAAFPLAVKVVFFMATPALGLENNILRQGLLLLPTYFLEGWIVAVAIRMAVLREPWPLDPAADPAYQQERRRSLTAATIIYVLVKLAVAVFTGIMVEKVMLMPKPDEAAAGNGAFLTAAFGILATLWAFRFLWLYVPAALGMKLRQFLHRIEPFQTSFYMLGLWLLCFTPIALVFLVLSSYLLGAFPPEGGAPAAAYLYIMAALQAVIELAITLVSSVAMAYAAVQIMTEKRP